MIQRVFVDTNCFLHLRDLKDLSWKEVFPQATKIAIQVAAVVIDELDRLKTEKTGRLRDRCRAALKQIEHASDQPGMSLQIRPANPEVWLTIAQSPAIDWTRFPQLDASRADDQLVASAVTEPGEEPTALLSHDTGPIIRARRIGLEAVRSPETWTLPSQQDPLEKENARLQRELDVARSTKPGLTARWLEQDEGGVVRPIIPTLAPLSESIRKRLLDRLEEKHPRAYVAVTDHSFGLSIGIAGVDRYQASSYHEKYGEFLEKARKQFANLHKLLETAFRFGEIRLELENPSKVTAESLRVALNIKAPAVMFAGLSDMKWIGGSLDPLEPPDPPRALYELPELYSMREGPRDPTKFYWLNRPVADNAGVLTCEEFRPAQVWTPSFYVTSKDDVGEIEAEIHGRNLTAPLIISARFEIVSGKADWHHPFVLSRLPDWMAEVIAEAY